MNKIIIYITLFILLFTNCGDYMREHKYPKVEEEKFIGVIRTRYDSPNPSQLQMERKSRSHKKIKSLELPILESLPVIEDSKDIIPREALEVSERALAVAIVAVKGEGLEQETIEEIINDWDIKNLFTVEENEFLYNYAPSKQDRINYAWKYECLDVLLWALGYKTEIPDPNKICNVGEDIEIIKKNNTPLKLSENSKLRSIEEILDMNDFYYRLHWSAIELRVTNKECIVIDEGIIRERHYALNWLIRYMNQSWDEITTDT